MEYWQIWLLSFQSISKSVYCTFSLTRIAEHCRGTPIILWGFHVTELALQIYALTQVSFYQMFPLNNKRYPSVLMYLPLNSIKLMAMLPGHQQSTTPSSLRRQDSAVTEKYAGKDTELLLLLLLLLTKDHVNYSHQHGATSCTSHRCQQFHWWGQMHRRLLSHLWRSQTMARNPAESTQMRLTDTENTVGDKTKQTNEKGKCKKTLTFCLASMILASRSAGITLPLKEYKAGNHISYLCHHI